MSLINEYLKRLGRNVSSSSKRSEGGVPPALQRLHKGSVTGPARKKYLLLAGIAVGVYCIGYFLVSVFSPPAQSIDAANVSQGVTTPSENASVETVAVVLREEVQEPTTPSSPEGAQSQKSTDSGTVSPAGKIEQRAGEQVSGQVPQVSGKISSQKITPITAPGAQLGQRGAEAGDGPDVSGSMRETLSSVDEEKKQTVQPSAIREEPYPLENGGSESGGTVSPAGMEQIPANTIVFTESKNKPAYFYQIALQAQHNNNFGRAERYYHQVLQAEPDHENALINLSAIFIQENRLAEADALLQKAITLNPKNSKALVNAGMIALQRKKRDMAGDFFRQALQYNPIEETALVNLAYLAQQDKDYDAAGAYFKKLIRITPGKTTILLAYAGLEEKRQAYDSAIALYRQCLNQMSMQEQPELYQKIKQRIQILRQYVSRKEYKNFFKVQ